MAFGKRGSAPPPTPSARLADIKKPTVLIYANDWGTGAHMVVADRLSQSLQRSGCKVILFTDDKTYKHMGGFTHVNGAKQTMVEVVTPPSQHKKAFEAALLSYKPDILVTEHYPMFNSPAMLVPMKECVMLAKDRLPNIQIHGLVRDVPSIRTIHDADIPMDETIPLYDSFLVRGDPRIYQYSDHFKSTDQGWNLIKDKVHYVGYALENLPNAPRAKNHETVITLGGSTRGMGDDVNLYRNLLHTLRSKDCPDTLFNKPCHFFVGSEELASELRREISRLPKLPNRPTITIDPFSKDFADHLAGADMVICRGGMTAMEAVAHRVPTLIIPRTYERFNEQKVRAEKLQQHAPDLVNIIPEQQALEPDQRPQLAAAIKQTATKGRIRSTTDLVFNGHENAADNIIRMFNGKPMVSLGGRTL